MSFLLPPSYYAKAIKQAADDKAKAAKAVAEATKAADAKARKEAEAKLAAAEAKQAAALLEKEKAAEAEKVAEEDEKQAVAAKSNKFCANRCEVRCCLPWSWGARTGKEREREGIRRVGGGAKLVR